jgi:predicted amidophosphoribosyltransferase
VNLATDEFFRHNVVLRFNDVSLLQNLEDGASSVTFKMCPNIWESWTMNKDCLSKKDRAKKCCWHSLYLWRRDFPWRRTWAWTPYHLQLRLLIEYP